MRRHNCPPCTRSELVGAPRKVRRSLSRLRQGEQLGPRRSNAEGEEIFRRVLDLLAELYRQAFISTHLLEFAARLEVE